MAAFARPADFVHGGGYEEQLDQLLAWRRPAVAGRTPARERPRRAAPLDVPLPPVFLLGSSPGSAVTAAARGLGYGFAAYSNPGAVAGAIVTYRERFEPARPGDRLPTPSWGCG